MLVQGARIENTMVIVNDISCTQDCSGKNITVSRIRMQKEEVGNQYKALRLRCKALQSD